MSGFTEDWYSEYRARMEALRVPVSGAGVDGALGRNKRVADASRPVASEPNLSRAGAAEPRRHSRPEEALQAAIVATWRPRLVPGARLFATNGELPGGAEQVRRAGRRKAMGYLRGTPDLCARRNGFLGWLECKAGYNKQTPEQVQWAEWAQRDCGDGYAVVLSVEDAGAVLRAWGFVA